MDSFRSKLKSVITTVGFVVVSAAAGAYFLIPPVHDYVSALFASKAKPAEFASKTPPAELIVGENNKFGVKLNKNAISRMELNPTPALIAAKEIPYPPMIGTLNYDMDRMFLVRPRFQGEVASLLMVKDSDYPQGAKKERPIRFNDRVEQGETLAVLWCRDLGEKKAALVDAILSLQLSTDSLVRFNDVYYGGGLPLTSLKLAERQVQSDINTWRTAERTLKMWKLDNKEIQEIIDEAKQMIVKNTDVKVEAKNLLDRKLNVNNDGKDLDNPLVVRDREIIEKWAKVPVKAPTIPEAPGRKLTVVEKNISRNDMVDPGRDTPLFRLADMGRLQIWVHPPEEYLPILRDRMKEGGLTWQIRFQSDPANAITEPLKVEFIAPSLEPNQHTPMLVGYLDNKDEKYLVGQFVTATIRVPPPLDSKKNPVTVEIPTDAINQIRGQNLVFVQNPDAPTEFFLRRVAVVQSSKKTSLVRMVLTKAEEDTNNIEVPKGSYPIEPLLPDERVITRGVLELTEALEELRSQNAGKQK